MALDLDENVEVDSVVSRDRSVESKVVFEDSSGLILRALSFPIDNLVMKYANEVGISKKNASEHASEVIRYLALCALYPQKKFPMARTVDRFWHEFIVNTVDYVNFCKAVAGRYIHHKPAGSSANDGGVDLMGDYKFFRFAYERHFGEAPPPQFWPNLELGPGGFGDCFNCWVMSDEDVV
ncbi:glycine-rich domain-containing protein [Xanthomonas arboricola pv. juglandis]|uniref:Uncharacterized protein n=2 Tax=Xanthomonas TaxID=338 RepID=A0A822K0I5_XANCJ|nr:MULTISPECIES: hypothetical protein [Xanthomonas]MDN0218694.1 hypothetical protein [Xanthomonas arboricola pv. juglandis]MDN0222943.1 hypothetical protein [Xanthomonas arboricola pv. juglandis]MDN0227218.1 hypothetical protein [Xanthomonas arboricola pv. juglandis]MDN0231504.1 hypothetical protein [Xanthomonas arboricola pv. juglandis]MDN0235719.1 hypothetical protein [Xanthomonas arboricola pv. juglandis]